MDKYELEKEKDALFRGEFEVVKELVAALPDGQVRYLSAFYTPHFDKFLHRTKYAKLLKLKILSKHYAYLLYAVFS